MSRSIYWKIAVPLVLIVVCIMAVLAIYMANFIRNRQMEQLRSRLVTEARLVADSSLTSLISPDLYHNIDKLAKDEGKDIDARITIIANDGTVLGDSWEDPTTMENHAGRPEIISALSSGVGESIRYSSTTGQSMMYVAVLAVSQKDTLGIARVALPLTQVEAAVNNAWRSLVWTMVIGALLIILMTAFITRMITRPVRRMIRAVQVITTGRLGESINIQTDDELGQLGHAFNKMSRSLQEMVKTISDEKSKLAVILSNINDGIIMTDAAGNIILANTAAERIFNFKEAQFIGHSLIEAVHDHEIVEVLKKSIQTAQEQSVQVESVTERFFRVIAVPLATTTSSDALILVQDLTEMRNLQMMRQEFLGNVSHELRTPLTTIKAIVETLQDGAIADKEVAYDFLNKVNNEVDGMTQMVMELIELSRIETGTLKLKLEPVNLNAITQDVFQRLSPLAERQGVTLVNNTTENIPTIMADGARIQQVIGNIIHNGIKFTPSGGKVTTQITVDPDKVLFTVSDTGIGISRQDLPHVFERFFKADKSRSSTGTGIGLAIAKHIVNAHGGRVWVQSEEGKGSTFGFSLPFPTTLSN